MLSWRCGRGISVCCPNDAPYSEPPPSVENHKNLRLLPHLSECGTSSADRLYGGNKTDLLEYPWMALISTQTTGRIKQTEFSCGGTVINDRYILTAAHCITGLSNRRLMGVRLGEWDISEEVDCDDGYCAPPVQDIAIEEVIPHPGYVSLISGKNQDLRNDIGLLRLADPIDLTVDNVSPICLPTTSQMREANLTDKQLVLTGWGRTNKLENGRIRTDFSDPRLLQITVPMVSNKICAEKYNASNFGGVGFRHLCVSGLDGVSSCSGDSGGPMGCSLTLPKRQIKFVQFGVVSAGYKDCGIKDQPSILTNVVYYMDWILDTIKP